MKNIITVLSFTLLLISCGWNINTTPNSQISENTESIVEAPDCEANAAASEKKLVDANKNPDVTLEFLWEVEANNTCYLKIKITQKVGVETAEVFTLFDTRTEQSYANYIDEKQMELAIIELNG